jgi:hypothetical protein
MGREISPFFYGLIYLMLLWNLNKALSYAQISTRCPPSAKVLWRMADPPIIMAEKDIR